MTKKYKFKPKIISGICKCGHSYEDHHLSMILNADALDEILEQAPFHPPYIPEECEYYGCNEMGGKDAEGNLHCETYEDDPDPCPFGCIFINGHLHGDCRAPESRDKCFINQQDKEKETKL